MYGVISSGRKNKQTKNWWSNSFTMGKWNGNHIEVGRKAEIQSHHKPHPRHSDQWSGRNSKPGASPWRVKGLYLTSGTPMFKSNTWDETQNIWLWKQAGLTPQDTWGCGEFLKGSHADSPTSGLSAETLWKEKNNYLQNFKALAWRKRSCWDTLWG